MQLHNLTLLTCMFFGITPVLFCHPTFSLSPPHAHSCYSSLSTILAMSLFLSLHVTDCGQRERECPQVSEFSEFINATGWD